AVHHLARAPGPRRAELSTASDPMCLPSVDESALSGCWLGLVVPKRHAKRAVTRTLLKRRIRAAVRDARGLAPGMWVVRLRTPFPRIEFISAASDRLSAVVTDELATLMTAAVARRPR
ncbi:MAG: ribonuclease P protein component, partial [Burkholderiaceae bacterium]|nr:ribonuclease P protein component [Burkholderiaceae bacterium]